MVEAAGDGGDPVAAVTGDPKRPATSGDDDVAAAVRNAYGRAAAQWSSGPSRMYDRLAEALVADCPVPLTATNVLDLGAGTGAASRVALHAGACVVAVDAALGMLAHDRHRRPPAVVADVRRLPLRAGSFDVVLASFVLNHLREPVRAITEAARVTRAGGCVMASTFGADWDHPAKRAVETVAANHGYVRPGWYDALKSDDVTRSGRRDVLVGLATAGGLHDVCVLEREVDVGLRDPSDLVAWRLGMANLAPFVASLPARERFELVAEATQAVAERPVPLRPAVLHLRGRVPGPGPGKENAGSDAPASRSTVV